MPLIPNAATGQYVSAMADPPEGSNLEALCNAYKAAYAKWLVKEKPRGPFNDALVNEVKPGAMRDALKSTQERGVGFLTEGKDEVNSLAELSKKDGALGKQAKEVQSALEELGRGSEESLGIFRLRQSSSMKGQMCDVFEGKIGRGLHPDFLEKGGTPIEVKRPNEPESHKGQKNHYAKCDPRKPQKCLCVPEDCNFK
jgi:hypothetical protein